VGERGRKPRGVVVEGGDESHCDDCLSRRRVDVPEQPCAERFLGRRIGGQRGDGLAELGWPRAEPASGPDEGGVARRLHDGRRQAAALQPRPPWPVHVDCVWAGVGPEGSRQRACSPAWPRICLGNGHPPATLGCLDGGGEPGDARADDCQVWFHKTGPSVWCPPSWKVAGNLWKVPANLPGVDPENVSAAQQGDALALDRLLDELAPYVRRLCARIVP